MANDRLHNINNEIKKYINEASAISNKCKLKLVSLVEKHFFVELPNENFENINIKILENGNIIMRDDEYQTSKTITNIDDIFNRFENFKLDAENLVNKNATNFETMKKKNQVSNLFIVFIILIISLALSIYALSLLLTGDFHGFLWLIFMLSYYVIPATGGKFKNRIKQAKNYLKSLFK